MKQIQKSKVKIGLEIHGYLQTKEKLFCQCATNYKIADPNTNICPICTGMPGSKPMLPNKHALRDVIAIALIFRCKINRKFFWQRKHYDWPDLPKGFQDTVSGASAIPIGVDGNFLGVQIRSVHLEEDPARWDPATGKVDYNRAGMPLVEIVTEPDFKSSTEVREWLKELVLALSYIKALDPDAGIKADVNISTGSERVEIKNVNSLRSIVDAIEYEIKRQTSLVKKGQKVKRETRAFIDEKGVTVMMREKEETEDYRFIPDPDLPTIEIGEKFVTDIGGKLPEMPQLKVTKFVEKGIREREAKILSKELELAEFFERVMEIIKPEIKELAAEWVATELLRVLHYNNKKITQVKIRPEHFSELVELIHKGKITPHNARQMLSKFVPKSFSPAEKLRKEKVSVITNEAEIGKICKEVLAQNKQAIEDFRRGEEKAFHFLIGKVMAATRGRADAAVVNRVLRKLLG